MAQLHCYVPEEIAQQAQRRASQSGLSQSSTRKPVTRPNSAVLCVTSVAL